MPKKTNFLKHETFVLESDWAGTATFIEDNVRLNSGELTEEEFSEKYSESSLLAEGAIVAAKNYFQRQGQLESPFVLLELDGNLGLPHVC